MIHVQVIQSSLLRLLTLTRSWITISVLIQPSSCFLVPIMQETDGLGLIFDERVDIGASVSELVIEAILDHEELCEDEDLDGPSHEIKGNGDDTIGQKCQFDLAFALIDVVFVVSDDVSVSVEGIGWELDLDELDYVVGEEESNRSIEKIINESQRANADIEQILTVIVRQGASEVLFVELGGLEYPQQTNQGCSECYNESVFQVHDAHDKEGALEEGLDDVGERDWLWRRWRWRWRRLLLLLIHHC